MTFLRHYLLALLVFNLAACSSMQTVNVENAMKNSPPLGIDYGSLVEVKTLDERSVRFRVTAINADGLGGAAGFYRYADMSSLRVDNPQYKKDKQSNTLSYVLGALGIAALVFLVANADSVSVCTPAPCHAP